MAEQRGVDASTASLQETQFSSAALVDSAVAVEEEARLEQLPGQTGGYTTHDDNAAVQTPNNGYGTSTISKPTAMNKPTLAVSARALGPDLLRGTIMVLQALDHFSAASGAYSHGQAMAGEEASKTVTRWNGPVGYTARLLTHLCAPGFMFLLGMGVVYFGRSRSKLGWTSLQMVRHFFIRALVLAVVNWVLGLMMIQRLKPMLNIILLALSFNYFITGLVWLATTWTEPQLARLIAVIMPDQTRDPETDSLLRTDRSDSASHPTVKQVASQVSFHIHNAVLLAASLVTIWWNIWLDPYHGHCPSNPSAPKQQSNIVFEFLFHELSNPYLFSGFPPLAWLSPALLGLLYARIVLSRPWKPLVINSTNLIIGLVLIVLFVLTRVLSFGNLDEACLAMPEHLANPDKNQHLASIRSFFYITKYPPSPSFFFFTMGGNFILLALYGTVPAKAVQYIPLSIIHTYGTSALFFYCLHLIIYGTFGTLAKKWFGHEVDWNDMMNPGHKALGIGHGVFFWVVYVLGLLILWPACRWYGRFKSTKGPDSVWRFF